MALRNPDFTTATIAAAINDYIGVPTAEPLDPSTIGLHRAAAIPRQRSLAAYTRSKLQVEPDFARQKMSLTEGSGIIVMGNDVRVHSRSGEGNLTVTITQRRARSASRRRSRAAAPPCRARTRIGVQEARARSWPRMACAQSTGSTRSACPAPSRDPAGHQGRAIQADIEVMRDDGSLHPLRARPGNRSRHRRSQERPARQPEAEQESRRAELRSCVPQFDVRADVPLHRMPSSAAMARPRLVLVPHRRLCEELHQGQRHRHRRSGLPQPDRRAGGRYAATPNGGDAAQALADSNCIMDRLTETIAEETARAWSRSALMRWLSAA